ncbi:hypothetical protein [Desulfonauticus submarinus]
MKILIIKDKIIELTNHLIEKKWAYLVKFSNTKFVNSMYVWIFIVPFIAKTFEFVNKEILYFKIFGESIAFYTGLPFSWKVFYFSALSFAIANLIIYIKCPSIIKDYSSFRSFFDDKKTIGDLSEYLKENNFDLTTLNDKGFTLFSDENLSEYPLKKAIPIEELSYYFSSIYSHANYTYKTFRMISSILFILGAMLFSWVILENTYVVLQFVFNTKT